MPSMRPTAAVRAGALLRPAVLLGAAVLLVAACSASAASSPSVPASAAASAAASAVASAAAYEVKVAQDAKLGAYLTGEDGKTLYVFKKDTGGKSACNGQCATNWPPFTLDTGETVTAGSGVTGTLASIKRDDGTTQVTYDGAPLYYFKGDQKAGDTTGQGVSGVWFVASPSGGAGSSAASPSAGSDSGAGGYGTRYGGGAGSASAAPAAGGSTASIVDFGFKPASLTVKAGTTVTWKNTGAISHTVTANDSSFDSGSLAAGATFQRTFATAGTFQYHCAIHPSMTGTIVVTP